MTLKRCRQPMSAASVDLQRATMRLYQRAAGLIARGDKAGALRILDRLKAGPLKTATRTLDIQWATEGADLIAATESKLLMIEESKALEYLRLTLDAQARDEKLTDVEICLRLFPDRITSADAPNPTDILKPTKRWAKRILKNEIVIPDEPKPTRKPPKA